MSDDTQYYYKYLKYKSKYLELKASQGGNPLLAKGLSMAVNLAKKNPGLVKNVANTAASSGLVGTLMSQGRSLSSFPPSRSSSSGMMSSARKDSDTKLAEQICQNSLIKSCGANPYGTVERYSKLNIAGREGSKEALNAIKADLSGNSCKGNNPFCMKTQIETCKKYVVGQNCKSANIRPKLQAEYKF